MIKVSGLSFHAGQTRILRNINLTLRAGTITGLIGPNGAGKSTLLHCLAGLNTLSGGQIRIDGLDPVTAPGRDRARKIALLQQAPAVVSRLRVRELVAFGRWPHHQGRATGRDADITQAALDAFDLGALADRPLDTLSGGQRQRAFVAMTYAQETPWILLDEPLNALDPRHAGNLMARLYRLSAQRARSIVVVLHDINAAARWSGDIVAMKDGQVMAHGPSAEVLTEARLAEVFETPFDILDHAGRKVVVQR